MRHPIPNLEHQFLGEGLGSLVSAFMQNSRAFDRAHDRLTRDHTQFRAEIEAALNFKRLHIASVNGAAVDDGGPGKDRGHA